MRKVYRAFAVMVGTAVGLPICWAQLQSSVRIQKAPAPVITNEITVDALNRLAAEQTRVLEQRNPGLVMAKTNKTLAQAMSYILADMAGHRPDKLPPGLTQSDISNAYFHMFIAPRPNSPSGTTPTKLYGKAHLSLSNGPPAHVDFLSQKAGRDGQPPPRPRQSQRQNVPDAQGSWASEPLPPGNNLQERLEELARRRGVPLNVLTQQALAQWSNAMSGAAQDMNRPIEFYGKAVDEKGDPLSGATVRFGCVVFPENHFTTNAVTDAQGMFSLTGVTGAVLNVRMSKEGYEEVQGTNQSSFAYYSLGGTGFYPDPNNPVIFYLRKKE